METLLPPTPTLFTLPSDDGMLSAEAEEMLGQAPGWLIRWGNAVTLAALVAGLGVSYLVSYPDTVTGSAIVSSEQAPIRIALSRPGRVAQVLVTEKDSVHSGTTLFVMGGAAQYDDIGLVKSWVTSHGWTPARLSVGPPPVSLSLGEVGVPYARLRAALTGWASYNAESYYDVREQSQAFQADAQRGLQETLRRELKLSGDELTIVRAELARARALFERDVISAADVTRAEQAVITQERLLAQAELAVKRGASEGVQASESVAASRRDRQTALQDLEREVAIAASGVADAVTIWEEEHVIEAPSGGLLTFLRPVQPGDYLPAGEPFAAVVSGGATTRVRAVLRTESAAQVRPGQPVQVRVDGFPATEFGHIEGEIEDVALAPSDEGYSVTVRLRNGLTTSTGVTLPLRQESPAEVQITLREASLLNRMLGQIAEVFD